MMITPVAVLLFGSVSSQIGDAGITGWGMMTKLPDDDEVHPASLVTVKEYVPGNKPVIVVLEPVPVIAPGLIIQVPDGNPFNSLLPVGTAQVGWVKLPNIGADGVAGGSFMTKLDDGKEVQPASLVTVKAYVPGNKPVIVVPEPVPVIPPGLIVQVPDGNPANTLLPVGTVHVGCVTLTNNGADGIAGGSTMTKLDDGNEVQPPSFVTVKAYVPGINPEIVVLEPVPVIAPGLIVHGPDGKPFNTLLPVGTAQVGCVILPSFGAAGFEGSSFITKLDDGNEVHPCLFVTVKEYTPGNSPEIVVLEPIPVIAPGLIVHGPDGKPVNTLLPVGTAQVGCVILPKIGADGVTLTVTAFSVAADALQPLPLV
jgi:hypothetical protein